MPDLGKIAYEAYCRSSGKSLISGANLPAWEELHDEIRRAWDVAAQAVLGARAFRDAVVGELLAFQPRGEPEEADDEQG